MQQYIKDCRVGQTRYFESDHRLIATSIETPKTKKARRKQIREFKNKKLDISALKNAETAELIAQELTRKFGNDEQQRSTADTSSKILYIQPQKRYYLRTRGKYRKKCGEMMVNSIHC